MTITISPEQLKSISIISTYVIGWVIACKILCYMSKRRILFWWPDDANDRAWTVVFCATIWPIVGFHLVVWGCGYLIHKVANRTLFPLMKSFSNVLFVPIWKQLVLSCEPEASITRNRINNDVHAIRKQQTNGEPKQRSGKIYNSITCDHGTNRPIEVRRGYFEYICSKTFHMGEIIWIDYGYHQHDATVWLKVVGGEVIDSPPLDVSTIDDTNATVLDRLVKYSFLRVEPPNDRYETP